MHFPTQSNRLYGRHTLVRVNILQSLSAILIANADFTTFLFSIFSQRQISAFVAAFNLHGSSTPLVVWLCCWGCFIGIVKPCLEHRAAKKIYQKTQRASKPKQNPIKLVWVVKVESHKRKILRWNPFLKSRCSWVQLAIAFNYFLGWSWRMEKFFSFVRFMFAFFFEKRASFIMKQNLITVESFSQSH